MEKKLDGNNIRMLRAILNKELYCNLPHITKTIQVRRIRHAGHCWRSKDELISDVLLMAPSHGRGKAGRPARTYIQQLCADTGCSLEDRPEAMDDREGSGRGSGISELMAWYDDDDILSDLFPRFVLLVFTCFFAFFLSFQHIPGFLFCFMIFVLSSVSYDDSLVHYTKHRKVVILYILLPLLVFFLFYIVT